MLSRRRSAAPQSTAIDETALTQDRPTTRSGAFLRFAALAGRALGVPVLLLGILATAIPFLVEGSGAFLLGLLMLASALLQLGHAYTLPVQRTGRSWFAGTGTSIVIGLLLLAASKLVFTALAFLLGISWIVDGISKIRRAISPQEISRTGLIFDGVISLVIGLAIAIQWPFAGAWTVHLAAGFRILATGWAMLMARRNLGDASSQPADASTVTDPLRDEIVVQEQALSATNRWWIITFLLVFFAIHVGRMESRWTIVELFSPLVAVVGDVFFALVICYVIVVPLRVVLSFLVIPFVRRVSTWGEVRSGIMRRLTASFANALLRWHTRFSVRLERATQSPSAGLRLGLLVGLPPTAVLVAIAPLLGISWYFNTETWATGAWDHWAAQRTDTWREEMVVAIRKDAAAKGIDEANLFRVDPGPIGPDEDFSFLVIGDPGEGDASQHILRDQYLSLGARPDVKFLVVSSDLIYPQGAMKDYEAKFYLPFKGFGKPIYAIPGNHDWYDALEAFNANLLEPSAARTALLARREADHKLTSTTEEKIESMLAQAATLRSQYGVESARQMAPFFEVQTPRFAMLAVDTGILRNIDPEQQAWLLAALERSRGKFLMILAGHPLYASRRYTIGEDDEFAAFHQLCREHDVRLLMAGDTHDFEVYREFFTHANQPREMLHVVNGGGGAYLSIGTAMDPPAIPALPEGAFYPKTSDIIAKLDRETTTLKRPVWWWTKHLKAWPSTPETLASAFASNSAPFYQSFCEIRVEPSQGRVRVIPYSANGRLRWRDLERFGEGMSSQDAGAFAEWSLPLAE